MHHLPLEIVDPGTHRCSNREAEGRLNSRCDVTGKRNPGVGPVGIGERVLRGQTVVPRGSPGVGARIIEPDSYWINAPRNHGGRRDLPNKPGGISQRLDLDDLIAGGQTKGAAPILRHLPLEIVVSGRRRRDHREAEFHLRVRHHIRRRHHRHDTPQRVGRRIGRQQPVVRARTPDVGSEIPHPHGHGINEGGQHGRRHTLGHKLGRVPGPTDRHRHVGGQITEQLDAILHHLPLEIIAPGNHGSREVEGKHSLRTRRHRARHRNPTARPNRVRVGILRRQPVAARQRPNIGADVQQPDDHRISQSGDDLGRSGLPDKPRRVPPRLH